MYIAGEVLDSCDDSYYGYYDDKSVYIKWIGIVIAIWYIYILTILAYRIGDGFV